MLGDDFQAAGPLLTQYSEARSAQEMLRGEAVVPHQKDILRAPL